jgi:hypothetical protein
MIGRHAVIAASGRLGKRVGLTALAGSNPASSAAMKLALTTEGLTCCCRVRRWWLPPGLAGKAGLCSFR